MASIALFSDDTDLRDMLNQLDDWQVIYFSLDLDTNHLPNDIRLAIFDFDVVPLSLMDEWEQFPRLHLRKIAVVSGENVKLLDTVLSRSDDFFVRPITAVQVSFKLQQLKDHEYLVRELLHLPDFLRDNFARILVITDLMLNHDSAFYEISSEELRQIFRRINCSAGQMQGLIHFMFKSFEVSQLWNYTFTRCSIELLVDLAVGSAKYRLEHESQIPQRNNNINVDHINESLECLCSVAIVAFYLSEIIFRTCRYFSSDNDPVLNIKVYKDRGQCIIQLVDENNSRRLEGYPHIFEQFCTPISDHQSIIEDMWDWNSDNCRKLIEMHGGDIGFESELGVGTTFYFTLPLAN